jgi:hypothetical protein
MKTRKILNVALATHLPTHDHQLARAHLSVRQRTAPAACRPEPIGEKTLLLTLKTF